MAKGKWSKYHPRIRCRYCGAVIKTEVYRVDGYKPCHKECAESHGLNPVKDKTS